MARLFLAFVPLLAAGCGSIPVHDAAILPAPVTSFAPVKSALVRLPVVVVFPTGGGAVQHIANLFKGGIKQLAQGIVLKSKLKGLWTDMEVPVFLDKDIWLLVRPESMAIGNMRTDLKQASTTHAVLEMTANPEVIFGPKPLTTLLVMPPLQPFQPGPGTFQAMSNTRITYEEANLFFRDPRLKLIGMVLQGTGRKLTLEGIRLYGSGGKVMVEVKLQYNPLLINFTGKPAPLTLYLSGTPRFLPQQRAVDFPDLDFDIKSNDLMVKIPGWILDSGIKDQLRKITRIPIGPKMDALKARLNVVLNKSLSPDISLSTQVNTFKILDGFADNDGIEVRVAIKGAATMQVMWN
ncbi:MAG TPA: DUF4403 family protein [bacterium]|jgi:hypothetical protein|nr:DUF4403 family protein [bacterium]